MSAATDRYAAECLIINRAVSRVEACRRGNNRRELLEAVAYRDQCRAAHRAARQAARHSNRGEGEGE